MPFGLTWGQLAIVAALAYVARLYSQYARLAAFRGPRTTGFSSLWILRAIHRQKTNLEYRDVNAKYGPLARIGPNELLTDSPELLWRMSAARSPWTKGVWYNGTRIQAGRDNVFSMNDEEGHTVRKGVVGPGYSGKDLPALESEIDSIVEQFLHLIKTKYISTPSEYRPMDLARKAQYFTLDVITQIAFGEAFGDIEDDEDKHKYIETTDEMLEVVIMASSLPALRSLFKVEWVGNLVFPSDKDGVGIGKLIGIAKEIVSKRFGPKPIYRQDMLDSFKRHGLGPADLVSESLVQILAGSDTSATTIRATMLYLMSHPRVYAKLQREIDSTISSRKATRPVITSTEAAALPYLQAVIKEGMRIWPAVTGQLTKVSPPEGDTVEIDGKSYFIPGGTNVGYDAWGVHRSKAVFGEDAECFRPERWLEASGERLALMTRTAELVWGYGKYVCLGRHVATMELNKVFFELLRNFDFCVVNPDRPWKSANLGLWMQSELWVEVTEREFA